MLMTVTFKYRMCLFVVIQRAIGSLAKVLNEHIVDFRILGLFVSCTSKYN